MLAVRGTSFIPAPWHGEAEGKEALVWEGTYHVLFILLQQQTKANLPHDTLRSVDASLRDRQILRDCLPDICYASLHGRALAWLIVLDNALNGHLDNTVLVHNLVLVNDAVLVHNFLHRDLPRGLGQYISSDHALFVHDVVRTARCKRVRVAWTTCTPLHV
jgi:hypothetical protein